MRKISTIAAAIAATIATASMPAAAQTQTGLVNVNLGDVTVQENLKNILNNNDIAIPVSVQVPIGIAANVCGTTVALLSQDVRNGVRDCNAQTANAALARIVARNARRTARQQ
jgi:hypothetical protein